MFVGLHAVWFGIFGQTVAAVLPYHPFRVGLQILFKEFKALRCKIGMFLILGANLERAAAVGPLNAHSRIIIGDAALTGRVVDISALVAELSDIT